MKRAHQLQPLSREHHLGLNLSNHAKNCSDNPDDILQHWQALEIYLTAMTAHFALEDNVLAKLLSPYEKDIPEIKAALVTLNQHHRELETLLTLMQAAERQGKPIQAEQVRKLATLLYDHIRFEERELFPLAEKQLNESQLNAIYDASDDNVKRFSEGR